MPRPPRLPPWGMARALAPLLGVLLLFGAALLWAAPAMGAPTLMGSHGGNNFQVHANASVTSGYAPLTVVFTVVAQGTSGHGARFNWSFGDSQMAHGPRVVHTFNTSGNYSVTVQGTDNGTGASSLDVLSLTVLSPPSGSPAPTGGGGSSSSSGALTAAPSYVTASPWTAFLGLTVVAALLFALWVARRRGSRRVAAHGPSRARTPSPPHDPSPKKRPKTADEGASPRSAAASEERPGSAHGSARPHGEPSGSKATRGREGGAPRSATRTVDGRKPSKLGPLAMSTIWISSGGGRWESSGSVPTAEATSDWQAKFREAVGLQRGQRTVVLPNGTDPNRIFVAGTPDDPAGMDLSNARRSR